MLLPARFRHACCVVWNGHAIRRWSSKRFQRSEEDDKLFQNPSVARGESHRDYISLVSLHSEHTRSQGYV